MCSPATATLSQTGDCFIPERRSRLRTPRPQDPWFQAAAGKNSAESFHVFDCAKQIISLGPSPLPSRLGHHGAHCLALAQEQETFFRQLRAGYAVRWIM